MNKILVWDLPIRLFHWVFAASLSASLAFGFLADEDSPLFQLHMLLGLVAAFALMVRLVLGIAGSRHNRFSALPLRLGELIGYGVGVISGKARRYIGHNPGGAVAALLMFALVPLLIASGAGWLEEDLHEGLAIGLAVVIGAHLAGIVWHTVRHRELVAMSMVTGRKEGPETEALKSNQPIWAMAVLVAGAAWVAALFANHDAKAGSVKIPLVGTTIQLGEYENEEDDEHHESRKSGSENREDDDD